MDEITGELSSVTALPGRADILSVTLADGMHYMFSMGPGATVKIGHEVAKTPGQFFDWLLTTQPVMVRLRPSGERYGLSMETDFKSAGA